ncbi:MAG: hypothetical protein ABJB74_00640 [Gemmatimonas sp.]
MRITDRVLLCGGLLSGAAALLHVGVIIGGPAWYRFFGAGERMARMAERGSSVPALMTGGIAVLLGLAALYAVSGAGVIRPLPLLRPVLTLIALVYLIRAVGGVPAVLFVDTPYMQMLKGRMTFMLITSVLCLGIGLCYAIGAAGLWRRNTLVAQRSEIRT